MFLSMCAPNAPSATPRPAHTHPISTNRREEPFTSIAPATRITCPPIATRRVSRHSSRSSRSFVHESRTPQSHEPSTSGSHSRGPSIRGCMYRGAGSWYPNGPLIGGPPAIPGNPRPAERNEPGRLELAIEAIPRIAVREGIVCGVAVPAGTRAGSSPDSKL